MKKNKIPISVMLFLTVFIASCGVDTVVVKPNYDFSKIKRVAVLTFKDAPYAQNSGAMVSDLFVKYLLKTGYNVIERDQLDAILREHQLTVEGIVNRNQAKEFGKIAGVDAIIIGSLPLEVPEREYFDNGYPRYIAAQVGITCRMIDVETGEIIWAASDTYDAMNVQTACDYLVSSIVSQLMKELARK